jgi:hypothetical protein
MERLRGLLGPSGGDGGGGGKLPAALSLLFATCALLGLLITMSTQGWAKISSNSATHPTGECAKP